MLANVTLAPKQVRRMTAQVGSGCVEHRREQVEQHAARPLMRRIMARPGSRSQKLAAVMMDGGRYQRRDHFKDRQEVSKRTVDDATAETVRKSTHWREEKVGIVLSMESEVHDCDPAPEFPEWLVGAEMIADLAKIAARDDEDAEAGSTDSLFSETADQSSGDWKDLAPKFVSRDVVASSENADTFGRHLEWKAWELGIHAAERQAFVADGLAANWTIHKQHFSQMTGILDLMHALSYAWRAAAVFNGRTVETGEMFVGMFMGDFSEAGVNVAFPAGSVTGVCSSIFAPRSPKFVPSFSWIDEAGMRRYDVERGVQSARKMMARCFASCSTALLVLD